MELTHAAPPIWRAIRPTGQVMLFLILFLVLSILCALPLTWLTGEKVLGIWYIFPFSILFLMMYQRLGHKETIWTLGIGLGRGWIAQATAGLAATGVGILIIEGVRYAAGWFEVSAVRLSPEPILVAAGIALSMVHNLGIGVGEELIFRGYIFRRLQLGHRSLYPPVVISSVVYTALHLPEKYHSPMAVLNLFLFGIVLALAVAHTRSLWLAIGIHMGWDLFNHGVFIYLVPEMTTSRIVSFSYQIYSQIELVAYKGVASLLLVAGIVYLALLIRRDQRNVIKENQQEVVR